MPCNGMKPEVSKKTESAVSTPITTNKPGWEILVEAANRVMKLTKEEQQMRGTWPNWQQICDNPGETCNCARCTIFTYEANLLARRDEIIPTNHLREVRTAVMRVVAIYGKVPRLVSDFMLSHRDPSDNS